jgi:glyoxylase-like metal-dependent hydrolase (beta-lactamase superfamily II)
VLIGDRESRLLKKDLSVDPDEPHAKPRGIYPGAKTQPTKLLKEGDHVGHLRVIETRGHTPGHLAFFDERDGTLLAGDALVGYARLRVVGDAPWYFGLANIATWHARMALESAHKLMMLDLDGVAMGHGSAIIGTVARDAMAEAVIHAEKKLARVTDPVTGN